MSKPKINVLLNSIEMKIKCLKNTSLEIIVDCLLNSFEGYFVQLPSDVSYWKKRYQAARVDLNYSYGMFDNQRMVGFIINGIDNINGELTAFNTGTGVLPAYRGNGVVDSLYEFAIPLLRDRGITRCQLEVITNNERAIKVYQRIGFNINRRLYCFKGILHSSNPQYPRINKTKSAGKIPNDYGDENLYSWDHTREAVTASGENYETFIVLSVDAKELGYFTINAQTGYVARIEKRQFGTYEDIIEAINQLTKEIKINNVDESRIQLRNHLMQAGLNNFIDQFEMEMKIQNP